MLNETRQSFHSRNNNASAIKNRFYALVPKQEISIEEETSTTSSSPAEINPENLQRKNAKRTEAIEMKSSKNPEPKPKNSKLPDPPPSESSPDLRGRPGFEIVHTCARESVLSHTNQQMDLKGLFNLLFITVISQNFGLVVENLLKYGVLVRLPYDLIVHQWPVAAGLLSMSLVAVLSFYMEKTLPDRYAHLRLGCQCLFIFMLLYTPHYIVSRGYLIPAAGVILLVFSYTWTLKLISFFHVFYDIRNADKFDTSLKYENKLASMHHMKFTDMWVYMFMPTLCFQFHYPRNTVIRWYIFFRHLFEMCICFALIHILAEQYICKIIDNTITKIQLTEMSVFSVIVIVWERLIKLSIPWTLVFMLQFVAIFHHWLNALAEVTRFADREFYKDWWNSYSFSEYWRKWNLPVHEFCKRHIKKPMTRRGVPHAVSTFLIFFASAVVHEHGTVVSLNIPWSGLIIMGFLFQLPLIVFTKLVFFKRHKLFGNTFFWLTLCFTGQPLVILIYYYIYSLEIGAEDSLKLRKDFSLLFAS